jgi:hypothetical protein
VSKRIWFGLWLFLLSATVMATEMAVYKSESCGCCNEWVKHLQANGFTVKTHNVDDVVKYKQLHKVPSDLASCHTGLVNGYVIEGHVPASDIKRLLSERPKVAGLAVPGMPIGSPGMEVKGTPAERYDVISFDKTGKTKVYAKH